MCVAGMAEKVMVVAISGVERSACMQRCSCEYNLLGPSDVGDALRR